MSGHSGWLDHTSFSKQCIVAVAGVTLYHLGRRWGWSARRTIRYSPSASQGVAAITSTRIVNQHFCKRWGFCNICSGGKEKQYSKPLL